ncbi:hypothetical protein TorRG33x02_287880 [Trema orientale]|uniref:Uncharacterized protein n=1 Tax=Trema orientale TaxID=63057 RepID=A0A2P5CF02_TREOI|nr:hypothetical protein TorRG33x02_287880 [Trema orientale]
MEIPSEFSHVSAATSPSPSPSPSICSLEDSMNFYSAPASPTSEFSYSPFRGLSQTEPTTPTATTTTTTTTTAYEDCGANFNLDEFEFDTSCRFLQFDDLESVQEPETPTAHEQKRGDSLPAMSFADELFCDGKVVPLALPQLKLPPRLCGGNNNFGGQSIGAAVSSSSLPRTPQSVLKLPFPRQCLWNDDFDPFMVAIQNVREEKGGKNHRRARSLSPLRARPSESVRPVLLENGIESNGLRQPNRSASMRWASPKEATKGEWTGPMQGTGFKSSEKRQLNGSAPPRREGKSPKLLAEPKGVVITRRMQGLGFKPNEKRQLNGSASPKREWERAKVLAEPKGVVIARQVRRAKMGPEEPSEPNKIPAQRPIAQTGNTSRGSGEPCIREIKRQQIMRRLLFKGASSKKVSDEDVDKVKYQNAALSKPTFMSRLSFKSINKTQYNEDKRVVSQVAKMTIEQYRPRLSLCLGYGSKYVQ